MKKSNYIIIFVIIIIVLILTLFIYNNYFLNNYTLNNIKTLNMTQNNFPYNIPVILEIKEKLKGVKAEKEALNIITNILGEPDRDLPSGISRPEWFIDISKYVSGNPKLKSFNTGLLTFNGCSGVDFMGIELVDKKHPIVENIFGSYELDQFTDDGHNKNRVGELYLYRDGKYSFKYSQDFINYWNGPSFFGKYPLGNYKIDYSNGINENILLEYITPDLNIAKITFSSGSIVESGNINIGEGVINITFNEKELEGITLRSKFWRCIFE
ncbi:MAG: hypothetical protein PHE25_06255 [Candidatus Gracilibacteria bacterium]|nr:hypothetical protein [Candidatus Gracilibacteria bacterium]